MRLEFRSFDGKKEARVGHGAECVLLQIREDGFSAGGIVLTADEADALGLRLRQQARASRRAIRDAA